MSQNAYIIFMDTDEPESSEAGMFYFIHPFLLKRNKGLIRSPEGDRGNIYDRLWDEDALQNVRAHLGLPFTLTIRRPF